MGCDGGISAGDVVDGFGLLIAFFAFEMGRQAGRELLAPALGGSGGGDGFVHMVVE